MFLYFFSVFSPRNMMIYLLLTILLCTVSNADEDFIDAIITSAEQEAYKVPLRKTSTWDESSMCQVIERISKFNLEIKAIFIRDKCTDTVMHACICRNHRPEIL